jgi:hypothetical protein
VQSSELLSKHRQMLVVETYHQRHGSIIETQTDSFLEPLGAFPRRQQFRVDGFSFNKDYIREHPSK